MGRAKLPPSSIWDDLRFASLDLKSMPMGPVRPMSTCSPGPLHSSGFLYLANEPA